jgi:hypothetical protein
VRAAATCLCKGEIVQLGRAAGDHREHAQRAHLIGLGNGERCGELMGERGRAAPSPSPK